MPWNPLIAVVPWGKDENHYIMQKYLVRYLPWCILRDTLILRGPGTLCIRSLIKYFRAEEMYVVYLHTKRKEYKPLENTEHWACISQGQ